MKNKSLHGEGRRLSIRAVKGAGVWRSLERSGNPCTEGADGAGAGFSQEGMGKADLAAAHKDARNIDLATAELRKIAPNSGSYVAESNFFNKEWQQEYWGTNYPKLRAIKERYDPDGLFFVHHGVGSEDWSEDGFTRIA